MGERLCLGWKPGTPFFPPPVGLQAVRADRRKGPCAPLPALGGPLRLRRKEALQGGIAQGHKGKGG